MQKIFTLFSLLLAVAMFGQTYQFDVLASYEMSRPKYVKPMENVVYSNTENQQYYLKVHRYDSEFFAILFDHQSKLKHVFNVNETKKGNAPFFDFSYVETQKLKPEISSFTNFRFELNQFNSNNVHLKIFNGKNKKKVNSEYDFTLEENEKNLFFIFRQALMHSYENWTDLDPNRKGIVKKALWKNKKNTEISLKTFKEVNFTITLPDKLITQN